MMQHIAEFLVSCFVLCGHDHESWPQRRRNLAGRFVGPSYRVCLDCGREREYTLLDAPQVLPSINADSWAMDCGLETTSRSEV